jgi:hypothetical protein
MISGECVYFVRVFATSLRFMFPEIRIISGESLFTPSLIHFKNSDSLEGSFSSSSLPKSAAFRPYLLPLENNVAKAQYAIHVKRGQRGFILYHSMILCRNLTCLG